ncbi:MAG: hypothetical protein V2I56_03495 [Desulfobacteraceae bacterium]|jgi:hypothetical protein|nr:hypothetical protein [Desulfobacteraceae bacterium]
MTTHYLNTLLLRYRRLSLVLLLSILFLTFLGCAVTRTVEETVEKTTQSVKDTTRTFTRGFKLSDEDLLRKVGIINFENNSIQETTEFQNIFHKGLPGYLNENCEGVLVDDTETGSLLSMLTKPPKLPSGHLDNYSLALTGRQLGFSAIVTGSLEDIRFNEEVQGILWTKDTHYFVEVVIRVEVNDVRTATKLLDYKFTDEVEIEDLEYEMIKQNDRIRLPELNASLSKLLADIGNEICHTVKDQPWTGFITKADADRFSISSGSEIGLKVGDVLEVYDSSRIIEGVGGQRFITPGLKIGEIEIVTLTADTSEARLISGKDIIKGSTVRRK